MIRYRGEEMWVGDDHVANLRLNSGTALPIAIQTLDGAVCFEARNKRKAELWVHIHAGELIRRAAEHRSITAL